MFGGFWPIYTFGLSTNRVTRHTPMASDRNGTVSGKVIMLDIAMFMFLWPRSRGSLNFRPSSLFIEG